eukprot:scaffold1350_cov137-Skeletonema_dohrnii-CCMP3373.AAC.6
MKRIEDAFVRAWKCFQGFDGVIMYDRYPPKSSKRLNARGSLQTGSLLFLRNGREDGRYEKSSLSMVCARASFAKPQIGLFYKPSDLFTRIHTSSSLLAACRVCSSLFFSNRTLTPAIATTTCFFLHYYILTMCNARSTTPSFNKKNQSSSSSSSRSESVDTKTAPCAPEQIEIDISNFSAQDLQSLKQDDPFLYYSIPGVRRATFNLEEPDMSESVSLEGQSTTVKRCTRVSFECHSDLIMEDLFGEIDDEELDQLDLEQMDLDLFRLLDLANARQQ